MSAQNKKGVKRMARKGENIYKRKDGRWEGRYISSHDNTGKAKYGYVYAKSYSDVKHKLNNIKSALGTLNTLTGKQKAVTLNTLSLKWLNEKRMIVKPSTLIRYQNTLEKHILPKLGSYKVSSIGTEEIKSFVQDLFLNGRLDGKGGLSPKTVSDTLVILKDILMFAQRSGITVLCDFSQIMLKKSPHEMRVLNVNEEKRLIAVLLSDMDKYKLGIFLCLFTGIRIGELCALQWRHVSFPDRTLRVEQTMQRLQQENRNSATKTEVIITSPKSFAANRTIPLPTFLVSVLKPFEESPDSFILSGSSKEFVEPRTMQNRFKAYLKEGCIQDANFHALRHTFATRCIEIGFEVKTLSEILGHSSVKITLDKYVHSSMEQKLLNMEKLCSIVK